MSCFLKIGVTLSWCAILLFCASGMAVADGMQPETTVVVLYEENGEATINIKNTDPGPALLHSVIENIPEDKEPLLIVTPPITRVEAGETQDWGRSIGVPGTGLHMHGTLWLLTQGETRKTKRVRLFTEFVSRRLAAYAPLLAGLSVSRDQ